MRKIQPAKRGIYFTLELITGNYNSDFLSIFSNSTSKIRVAPPVKEKRDIYIYIIEMHGPRPSSLDLMKTSPFDSQAFRVFWFEQIRLTWLCLVTINYRKIILDSNQSCFKVRKLILILFILKNSKQNTYQESQEELLYHHNLEDDSKIGNRSLYTYFNGMKLKNDNEVGNRSSYRQIVANVIVHIFPHQHTT